MFKPGDQVRYSKPVDAAEDALRFVVLEAHYDCKPQRVRVVCTEFSGWTIPPTETLPPSELAPSCAF